MRPQALLDQGPPGAAACTDYIFTTGEESKWEINQTLKLHFIV